MAFYIPRRSRNRVVTGEKNRRRETIIFFFKTRYASPAVILVVPARHDGNTNLKVGWKSLLRRSSAKKIPRRRQLVRRRFPRVVDDDAATARGDGSFRGGDERGGRKRGKEAGFFGGERHRRRRRNTRIAIDARTHQTNTWFTWPARTYHLATRSPHRRNDTIADDSPTPRNLPCRHTD